jgi:hypothetical protein
MRRSPFDLLGWVALVAFGLSFWALYHAARRTPAEDPQAQVLDPSAEIQEGHEWMGLYFRGERAGYAHVHKERLATGWRSFLETRFRLLGAAGGEVLLEVDARLGVDLALEHFTFVLEAGPALLRGQGTVAGSDLSLEVETGGERTRRTLTLPAPPTLRGLVGARLGGRVLTPGQRLSFAVFDPLTQREEPLEVEVIGPTSLVVLGSEVPVTQIRQHVRGVALDGWINARGEMLRQELGLGLVALRETEEEARFGMVQARSGRAGADLRALTSIVAEGMPADLKGISELRLRLGGVELDGLALDDHRQARVGDVVTIRREGAVVGRPLGGDDPALAAEALVQSDHPKIRAMAQRVVGDAADTRVAAERILAWVHDHVDQAVVAGVPSALEVLEKRQGDCNEHAVLFAALARAAGVPTRIETGLAWQEGRFAWHAWNAVKVEGGWLSVDPTWRQLPADVGHLRIATGGLAAQADLLRVVGRLTISVVPEVK